MQQVLGCSVSYRIAIGPQQGRKMFTLHSIPAWEGEPISIERGQNTRTASPGHDLGAAPQARVQHRCVDLPEVWRRSQSDRLYRGSGGHRQDSSALTGQGGIATATGIA
ncbi:MAG: hypothetical protein K1563_15125, partial [Candidatus Thiodiazotropha sp. (ex. Lucinisca nassula)]|nr:hypothetical protein [Candidatus Thiodiazotropha sp. (ex. Lucinisca nassula)]